MKAFSSQGVVPILVTGVVLLSLVPSRADFIDFSGLTISTTPVSVPYRSDDGSVGTVSIFLFSGPSSGTPFLSGATGLYKGSNSAATSSSWYERLVFDRPVSLELNNFETYSSYERTFLVTDGTSWTGGFSTRPVPGYNHSDPTMGVADGLGTKSLVIYGNANAGNGDYWPYGYFQSGAVKVLDVGYGVIGANGQDANGVAFNVIAIPEPSTISLLVVLCAASLRLGRSRPVPKSAQSFAV